MSARLNWRPRGDQGLEAAEVSIISARVSPCSGGSFAFSWAVDNETTMITGYGDTLEEAKRGAESAAGTLIESLIVKRERELAVLRKAVWS